MASKRTLNRSNSQPHAQSMQITSGPITAHSIRLTPGQDLVPALEYAAAAACHSTGSGAAFILTAVGSLSSVTLRLASAHSGGITAASSSPERTWNEPVEVTSLVGTMAVSDEFIIGKHWHMSISDEAGFSFGGHVMAATVWTTMEIVLGTIGNGVSFSREMDSATGYRELVVRQQQPQEGEDREDREEEKETKQQEITEEVGDNGKPSWMAKLKKMKVKAEPVEPEKETSQPGWQMRNMLKKKRDMEAGIIESGGDDEESTEEYDDEDDQNDVWANVNMNKAGLREEEIANEIEEPGGEASSAKKMDKGEKMQSRWDDDRDDDWSDVKVKSSDERFSDKKDKKSKKEKDSDNDSDNLSLSSHSSHSSHSQSSRSSKKSSDKDMDSSKHDEKGKKDKKKESKKDKKKDKSSDKDMDNSKHDEKEKKDKKKESKKDKKDKSSDKDMDNSKHDKKEKKDETPDEKAKRKEKDKKSDKKDKKSEKKDKDKSESKDKKDKKSEKKDKEKKDKKKEKA